MVRLTMQRKTLQSKTQSLDIKIFRREIHLPSAANEWHIPPNAALPKPPGSFFRREPEEEHETSYFAPSVKIFCRYYSTRQKKSQTFVRILCGQFLEKRLASGKKICYNRRERKGRNAARRRRLCATHPRDGKNIAGNAGENIDNAENV